MSNFWAVVPAAGVGKRMLADRPKQYLPLQGKPILEHTLQRLASHSRISGVVVAVGSDDPYWAELPRDFAKPVYEAEGGAERCHSVLSGLRRLQHVADDHDWVLVHDAARPCVRHEDISRLMETLGDHPHGGLLGLPVSDTIKLCDEEGVVQRTVDRSGLWRALTPQMFRLGELLQALLKAIDGEQLVTDEASAMEMAGISPLMVEGHADNIKVTHPQDLKLAEIYLQYQKETSCV